MNNQVTDHILHCWDRKLIDLNISVSRSSYHKSWETVSRKFHPRGEPGSEAERRQKGNLLPLNSGPVIAHYTPRIAAVRIPAPVKPIQPTEQVFSELKVDDGIRSWLTHVIWLIVWNVHVMRRRRWYSTGYKDPRNWVINFLSSLYLTTHSL